MKYFIVLLILGIWGCDENPSPVVNMISRDSAISNANNKVDTIDSTNITDKGEVEILNSKDAKGRRQGKWDHYWNGNITGFDTYKDNKLDGPYSYWTASPGQMNEGQYKKGLRVGLQRYYYKNGEYKGVIAFDNDSILWYGFPTADMYYDEPIKGFGIYSDSIFVECPYRNGTIWYKGLFVNKKPTGIHKMYYPNGNIRFLRDYNTQIVSVFDSTGKFIRKQQAGIIPQTLY
ncbi:hypothetical protein BH09BAC5_BH09BAC5_15360 [soil metagenome]